METSLLGKTCTALAIEGNHVVCIYRRADRRVLWVSLAQIDGDTWRSVAECARRGAGKVSRAHAAHSVTASKFGFPNLIRLRDGDAFFVLWCVENCVYNRRWFGLRLDLEVQAFLP